MPIISQFYGILIFMYYNENDRHNRPHLHAQYNEYDSVFDLKGEQIIGNFPNKQRKMVETWILIHEEELKKLWNDLKSKNESYEIDPLQ